MNDIEIIRDALTDGKRAMENEYPKHYVIGSFKQALAALERIEKNNECNIVSAYEPHKFNNGEFTGVITTSPKGNDDE